jgi:hypothetical protein
MWVQSNNSFQFQPMVLANIIMLMVFVSGVICIYAYIIYTKYMQVTLLKKHKPKMSVGVMRQTTLSSSETQFHALTWVDCIYFVFSLFLVPYEKHITQIYHNVKKPDDGHIFVSQELMHSTIHRKYNKQALQIAYQQNSWNKLILPVTIKLFDIIFWVWSLFPSTLSKFSTAIMEKRFYYDTSIQRQFKLLSRIKSPLLKKIFLWHVYEEMEHHVEPVYMFESQHGRNIYLWIPFALIYHLLLVYTFNFCAFILCVANSPLLQFQSIFRNLIRTLISVMMNEVCAVWSTGLIVLKLSYSDDKVQTDLKIFRNMCLEKRDLNLDNVQLTI